jgi:hypothetical protein
VKNEEAREKAREIMKSRRGHFINFYGPRATEVIEAQPSVPPES